jgi:hypothetical protein
VETIRRECLDHVIVVNEGHLRGVLAAFTHYYNHDRPHRTLSSESSAAPQSRARSCGLDAGARRPAPCLRACGLNSDGLLPPHTRSPRDARKTVVVWAARALRPHQSLTAKVTANRMDFPGRARTSTDSGWSRTYTRWTAMDAYGHLFVCLRNRPPPPELRSGSKDPNV